jgi:hypothetical protein
MFRLIMVTLSRLFHWRKSLVIVKPDTFVRFHREGFTLFWRWKSRRRGRPIEDYERLLTQLDAVLEVTGAFPVGREVRLARRKLKERLPWIREFEAMNRTDHRLMRKAMMEAPPACPKGHPMSIRERRDNGHHSWGCSRYPLCVETTPLSPDQKEALSA